MNRRDWIPQGREEPKSNLRPPRHHLRPQTEPDSFITTAVVSFSSSGPHENVLFKYLPIYSMQYHIHVFIIILLNNKSTCDFITVEHRFTCEKCVYCAHVVLRHEANDADLSHYM